MCAKPQAHYLNSVGVSDMTAYKELKKYATVHLSVATTGLAVSFFHPVSEVVLVGLLIMSTINHVGGKIIEHIDVAMRNDKEQQK